MTRHLIHELFFKSPFCTVNSFLFQAISQRNGSCNREFPVAGLHFSGCIRIHNCSINTLKAIYPAPLPLLNPPSSRRRGKIPSTSQQRKEKKT